MELVAADFLRHSVEMTLRKFFRTVRSVKGSTLPDQSLRTPELCAQYLRDLFFKLSEELSEHHSMKRMEAYYRFRLARRLDAPPVITITPAKTDNPTSKADRKVQIQTPAIDDRKPSSAKVCAGHLGAQLGAIREDGSSYECKFGRECAYKHISKEGETPEKLAEAMASMPPMAQADLRKALLKKK